jgi:hypothetical protein
VIVLALSYAAGGYVAARMARFDGIRQGIGVWVVALLMTAALGLTAWLGGGDVNFLRNLDLPRIPVDEDGDFTTGAAIATAAIAVATLLAAIGGAIAGERFHRAVDEAGVDLASQPEWQPKAEADADPDTVAEPDTVVDSEPDQESEPDGGFRPGRAGNPD